MNELVARKIRFGDMARGADMTPKAFRNWLQRYPLHLLSEVKSESWTEFSHGDLAIIALTHELVRWGMGVPYANEIAFTEIHRKAGPMLTHKNTPADALASLLSQWVLAIYGADENGDALTATLAVSELRQTDLASKEPALLLINLGEVVKRAFERLDGPVSANA